MKKRDMCILHRGLLLCLLVSCGYGLNIKGYEFGDNMMNVRMGPDNGFLRADMQGLIPPNMSICTRIYTANIRHGNQLGIWSIYTPYNSRVPIFDLQCRGEDYCTSEYHGDLIPQPDAYPKVNMIRKWSSICIGMNFLTDMITAYYNGKEVNSQLEVERKEGGYQALNMRLPKDYFSGTI